MNILIRTAANKRLVTFIEDPKRRTQKVRERCQTIQDKVSWELISFKKITSIKLPSFHIS